MERFDIHKWKPTECRNVEEIKAALRKFNAIGRKIVSLRTIGAAENFNQWSDEYELSDNAEDSEYKTVPLRALLYEPVVFEFEDGNTLEIMSKGKSTLLIASNQIPHGITEGLNHPNYDSEWFFRKIKNAAFTGRVSGKIRNNKETFEYDFCLSLDGKPLDFHANVSCEAEYVNALFEFSLEKNDETDSYITVPVGEYINAANYLRQVIMADAWMYLGGYFTIYPLNRVKPTEENYFGVIAFRKEMITINEMDVDDFLYSFLIRHFDEDYDYGEMRDEHSDGFEYYSEFNLYTYGTVRKMIEDIKSYADMLENDLENPALDKLKDSIAHGGDDRQYPESKEEKLKAIKENVPVAIDFYRRLSARLEAMMDNAPDYEFICFMGP